MPPNTHCNCEKLAHESTGAAREKREKNLRARVPGQRRLAFTSSKIPKKIEEEKKRKKTYLSVWPVSQCNSNPVMASQTTTCMPSVRASFDPQLEYATDTTGTESLASIVNWQG